MKIDAELVDSGHLGVVLDIPCPVCDQTLLSVAGEDAAVQCEHCGRWFEITGNIEIKEVPG